MKQGVKKALTITGIALGAVLGALLIVYASFWIVRAVKYDENMKVRRFVCDIPDINAGFVPQGVSYDEASGTYIMTGYKGDEVALYMVKNNVGSRVMLANAKGKPLNGHGGGVTCAHDHVYIADEYTVYDYSLTALKAAKGKNKRVKPQAVRYMDNRADYCFSDGGRLFVGEFYREKNVEYHTERSHHVKTPGGEKHYAIVSCYALDESGGIASDYPEYAISVTDLVQGFAVSGDTYILSRSYGLVDSKLEYYKPPVPVGEITVKFKKDKAKAARTVPLYALDKTNIKKTLTLPSFSEDLVIVKNRVVVNNEAGCNKYFIGKLFGATKMYSYPIY